MHFKFFNFSRLLYKIPIFLGRNNEEISSLHTERSISSLSRKLKQSKLLLDHLLLSRRLFKFIKIYKGVSDSILTKTTEERKAIEIFEPIILMLHLSSVLTHVKFNKNLIPHLTKDLTKKNYFLYLTSSKIIYHPNYLIIDIYPLASIEGEVF